jgi:hypothetical protein
MPYQSLDPGRIIETISILKQRVGERFPDSGPAKVAAELHGLAVKAQDSTDEITRPILGLRVASGLLVALIVVGLIAMVFSLGGGTGST